MACVSQIGAGSLGSGVVSEKRNSVETQISSLSYNAGTSSAGLRNVCELGHQRWALRAKAAAVIRAAASKQKKKLKEKTKSSAAGDKQWKFDELMLVWDDVFLKACENTTTATALYDLSRRGFSRYGRGCVLIQESVTTRPWGAASGFTFKSRYSSSDSPQLPSYSSGQWNAEYVPKEFILDPSKAPESSDTADALTVDDEVQVVDQGRLFSVLRGIDRTRLLGLLADLESDNLSDAGARDAGGEDPCDPAKDELVIVLSLAVDGQQAVGADVLRAFPTVQDGLSSNTATFWTLKLRDDLPV